MSEQTDSRIEALAEWLHNRDHRTDSESWSAADASVMQSYRVEARSALRFVDGATR